MHRSDFDQKDRGSKLIESSNKTEMSTGTMGTKKTNLFWFITHRKTFERFITDVAYETCSQITKRIFRRLKAKLIYQFGFNLLTIISRLRLTQKLDIGAIALLVCFIGLVALLVLQQKACGE